MITFIKNLLWLHKASILAASETSPDDSAEVIYYRKRTRAAFPIMRGTDEDFYLFSYVSQQFLLMILLENLFPRSSTFKSSLEENRVQQAGIIRTCSLCSSTAWHPSPLAGPPPIAADALLHPLLLTRGCPRQLWIPDERIKLSGLTAVYPGDHRKGKTFCLLCFLAAVRSQRQPITCMNKPRRWEQRFVPAAAGG